jgi:NhaP-type Na+/H+ or K+/H+ antiporter
MTAETFVATMAIVGLVITVSTLLSGVIDWSGVPHAAVFLLLGLMLGPHGAAALDVRVDSPILRVVATLSLVLVLFTDALGLDFKEVRRHVGLALRVLGPGTLLSAAIVTLAGCWLLDLPPAAAVVLGAALASTDPVLLRGMLRRADLPESARVALRLESGLNDAVLLPIVLAATALMAAGDPAWGRLAIDVLLLGPAAGAVVGLIGVSVLTAIRRRTAIRRDYESLYSLGIALTAFAAAEALHGSGYLAAFTAGLTILALDVELCDCFLEYGETTAEMLLMFAFVLFGTSPLWIGLGDLSVETILFAAIVLAARPLVFLLALAGTGLERRPRLIVSWFGPRGLSSLLLVALPVFAGVPGSDQLLHLCSIVVIASILVHGGSLVVLARRGRIAAARVGAEGPPLAGTSAGTLTIAELRAVQDAGETIVVADVRTLRTIRDSELAAAGAIRLDPERAVEDAQAQDVPKDALIALYCA